MAKTESKCEDCIFYKLQSQPSYLIDGEVPVLCCEYKEGIPKEYWEGKKNCKEYLKDISN